MADIQINYRIVNEFIESCACENESNDLIESMKAYVEESGLTIEIFDAVWRPRIISQMCRKERLYRSKNAWKGEEAFGVMCDNTVLLFILPEHRPSILSAKSKALKAMLKVDVLEPLLTEAEND